MATASAGAIARNKFGVPDRVGQCWTTGRPVAPYMDVPKIIEQRAAQAVSAPTVVPVTVATPAVASAPTSNPMPAVAPATPTAPTPQWNKHVVEAGDTLSKLAFKYKTSIKAIQALNQLSNTTIKVGETLKIPTK